MRRSARRLRIVTIAAAILALAVGAGVWVGAVERSIGHELRALAAAHLNPTFSFDELNYTFPSTATLRGVRLTSPDPEAPGRSIEILAMNSLTLVLSEIPRPGRPFRMRRLRLAGPTLRLVRTRAGEASGNLAGSLVGYSDLLKEERETAAQPAPPAQPAQPAQPPDRLSDLFEVRAVSIEGGRAQFDPRDGGAAIMLIDGITAKLLLQPSAAGVYGIDFSLGHHPAVTVALRGRLLADDKQLEVDALSSTLQLERAQDQYLTPFLQKLVAERDISGRLTLEATGVIELDDTASSRLHADLELSDGHYAVGDYALALDRVRSRISLAGKTVALEEFAIDALGGHAKLGGTIDLDDSLTGALSYEGADLQIGALLRGADAPKGVPAFSGLLGFSGTLRGPLVDIDRQAQGKGRMTLRKARLGRLPVLSTVDKALDRAAEAAMKRERIGHDQLSLEFSFDGDRARIRRLRMNSRWYGLRGHGDLYLDSRLDLAVDGGPLQELENEIGPAGDVLGEITETLVRARVTGTLGAPKVGIEILRHPLR